MGKLWAFGKNSLYRCKLTQSLKKIKNFLLILPISNPGFFQNGRNVVAPQFSLVCSGLVFLVLLQASSHLFCSGGAQAPLNFSGGGGGGGGGGFSTPGPL